MSHTEQWCSTTNSCPQCAQTIYDALDIIDEAGWTHQQLAQVARLLQRIAWRATPSGTGTEALADVVTLIPLLTTPAALRKPISNLGN